MMRIQCSLLHQLFCLQNARILLKNSFPINDYWEHLGDDMLPMNGRLLSNNRNQSDISVRICLFSFAHLVRSQVETVTCILDRTPEQRCRNK